MKGMPGGLQGFMKQANQLQAKMEKLQADLAERTYETSSGGGAVKTTVNGKNQIVTLTISQEVIKSGDAEMLQDLVTTAVNEALKIAKETGEKETSKITGGMNFPGLF